MPLDNVPLNPIDETNVNDIIQGRSNVGRTMPNLDVNLDLFDPKALRTGPGFVLTPNPQSIPVSEEATIGSPGFISTFAHGLARTNELVNAGKFLVNSANERNHLDDYVPDDWTPMTIESLSGFPNKYAAYITSAVSPKDQQARQQRVKEQMRDDEYYSRGNIVSAIAGNIAGGLTSPSSYLIPMSAGVKMATFGQNIVKNMVKGLPGVSASIVASEGAYQAGRAGGNLQDMAVDSLHDIVFAAGFIGAGATVSHALSGNLLSQMRNYAKINFKGVDIHPVINEKGEVVGQKAVASPQLNVGAAQVQEAQAYIDSSIQKRGILSLVPDKALGALSLGSPVVRLLNSPFVATRYFMDRMASHGIITEGLAAGKARPDSAEDLLGYARAQATVFSTAYKGTFLAANGIEGGVNVKNTVKNMLQTRSENRNFTETEFGKAVRDVIYTDNPHTSSHVNEAAKMTMDFVKRVGDEFRAAHGWEEDFFPPRTAVNYLMQNYNIEAIIKNEPEFTRVVADAYKQQDAIIQKLNAPLLEAEARLNELKAAQKEPGWVETRALANELAEARGRLNRERDNLVKQLRDNPDYHILAEDRILLDSGEAEKLQNILQPLEDLKAEHQKMKSILSDLNAQRSSINSSIQKNVKEETRLNNIKKLEELEKQIEFQQSSTEAHEIKIQEEDARLQERVASGEIPRKFYRKKPETSHVEFRNPFELPKLRKVFESDQAREEYAYQLSQKIQGNTPEQLNQQVLGQMFPGAVENPQYLQARTVMIPSTVFNDAGFLDADVGKAVTAYANTMGKYTALKTVFNNHLSSTGIDGLLDDLASERSKKAEEINKMPKSKERDKALMKLKKDYDKNVSDMKAIYDSFMGRSRGTAKSRRVAANLRNFTAAAKLGGVPISQLGDLGAIVLKNTLFKTFKDGLIPAVRSLNGRVGGAQGEAFRLTAAHAYVAIEHVHNGHMQKWYGSDGMSEIALTGRLENGLENLAHLSGNFYGTNYVENLNQTITANIFQSKVMAAMYDFKAGKLTDKQHTNMAQYGIDVPLWANRFIDNFEKHDGQQYLGAYQGNYFNWQDVEASNRMSRSIRRAVYDTTIQRGMFSSPLWTNDPMLGLIAMFHGWAYSSMTRYLIPTLQRPDAQAIMGISTMFGLAMLQEPLREWANGQKADTDEDHLFLKSVSNAGFLGPWPEVIQATNALMHGNFLPGLTNQKYRDRSVLGVAAGPVGGVFETAWALAEMGWTGKINQQGFKQGLRSLPLAGNLLLRGYLNKAVEGSNLPEKPSEAEGWSWWEQLNNQR